MARAGSLPTPTCNTSTWQSKDGAIYPTLHGLATGAYPTPRANDAHGKGRHQLTTAVLPTPMASDGRRGSKGQRRSANAEGGPHLMEVLAAYRAGDQLPTSVLPTPTASAGERGQRGELVSMVRHGHHGRRRNSDFVARDEGEGSSTYAVEPGVSLHPRFVEWMMGVPPGWTDLDGDDLPPTDPDSKPSATASSSTSPRRSAPASSRSSGRAADWLGRQATDADFDRVLRGREIITDDDGVAIAYLPGVLSGDASDAAVVAFGDLADVEAPSLTRRQAAGPLDLDRLREIRPDVVAVDAVSPTSGHLVLADGRTLRQVVCNPVRSYLAGWSVGRFDGPTRMKHALRVASAEPLLAELDMALSSAPTERGRMIGTIGGHGLEGTPFSTLTINVDYESRYHLDRGDFRGGLCALAAFAIAPYSGGLIVFPRRRIAVDLAPGRDVLLFRAHEEIHGNTAVSRLTPARWGRLSIVAYLKDKLSNVTDAR